MISYLILFCNSIAVFGVSSVIRTHSPIRDTKRPGENRLVSEVTLFDFGTKTSTRTCLIPNSRYFCFSKLPFIIIFSGKNLDSDFGLAKDKPQTSAFNFGGINLGSKVAVGCSIFVIANGFGAIIRLVWSSDWALCVIFRYDFRPTTLTKDLCVLCGFGDKLLVCGSSRGFRKVVTNFSNVSILASFLTKVWEDCLRIPTD